MLGARRAKEKIDPAFGEAGLSTGAMHGIMTGEA